MPISVAALRESLVHLEQAIVKMRDNGEKLAALPHSDRREQLLAIHERSMARLERNRSNVLTELDLLKWLDLDTKIPRKIGSIGAIDTPKGASSAIPRSH